MANTGKGKPFRSRAISFVAWLSIGSTTIGTAIAQGRAFNCGREDHERLSDPGAAWFDHFERRSALGLALRKNANEDLARRFDECAFEALRRAAEFGHREAQYQYGLRLALREPKTPASMAEAHMWLKRAAERGHKLAQQIIQTWPR